MASSDGIEAGRPRKEPNAGAEGHASPDTSADDWLRSSKDLPEHFGLYRVKKRLGGGGMGAVYLVENTKLERDEALKVPHFASGSDASVRERFLREAKAAAKLDHRNLCPIYDVGEIHGICFLTMRLLPGKPLSDQIGYHHPAPEAVKIIVDLARALDHAHEKGIIHRDLKPSNVMMCPDTGPTVMDFGLAKQTLQRKEKLTEYGKAMGTAHYMPPEQIRGELDRIGAATDVYSLGVILFELLTGRLPFEGSSNEEVMGKALFTNTPLPSQLRHGLSPALDRVVGKAMAKEPEARYPSMKVFIGELEGLLRTQLPTADNDPLPPPPDESVHDKPTVVPGKTTSSKPEPRRRQPPKPKSGVVDAIKKILFGARSTNEVVNEIGMTLVRIPAGGFRMGSPKGEAGHVNDEEQHHVELSEFWLGVHQVTQGEFRAVLGYNPSYFSRDARGKEGEVYVVKPPGGGKNAVPNDEGTEDYPVENVTWHEAMEFCRKLNSMDSKKPQGWEYRLPREGEWEYACRAGSTSYQVFHVGDALGSTQANFDGRSPYGDADKDEFLERTCMVGSFEANAFGLKDMHGNVLEWCQDWYGVDYYGKSPLNDPQGPAEGSDRVARGGSWRCPGRLCRSAFRFRSTPSARSYNLGFRVALARSGK